MRRRTVGLWRAVGRWARRLAGGWFVPPVGHVPAARSIGGLPDRVIPGARFRVFARDDELAAAEQLLKRIHTAAAARGAHHRAGFECSLDPHRAVLVVNLGVLV